MKNKSFFIFFLILMLSSCASTLQYTKVAQPNIVYKDMATIYVLRPSSFGSAIKFRIYQDGKLIGKLGPKSYLAWSVKPEDKELSIISKSENKDMLTIKPQSGKSYFIILNVKMGIVKARSGLEFLDENEGKNILLKLKSPTSRYSE